MIKMEIERQFEIARKSMEDLLRKFPVVLGPNTNAPYALEMPQSHPAILNKGTNSIVFELPAIQDGDYKLNFVGKALMYLERPQQPQVLEGFYHLFGANSGMAPCPFSFDRTLYWIKKEFGREKSILVPEQRQYELKCPYKDPKFGNKYFKFTIMHDLREGGNFRVDEADGFNFIDLSNGDELRSLFESSVSRIESLCKENDLNLEPAGHGTEEDPSQAIKHIFLVQSNYTDPLNEKFGRLVASDLNHLHIYKDGEDFGEKPDYLN